jgi:hypothetical protein
MSRAAVISAALAIPCAFLSAVYAGRARRWSRVADLAANEAYGSCSDAAQAFSDADQAAASVRHLLPSGEVHVDWRMTPAEWDELRSVLLAARSSSPYVTRLADAGKLGLDLAWPLGEPPW